MMHWGAKHIGRTPEAVGLCWGLLRLVYAEFGIQVPEVKGLTRENAAAVAAGVRDGLKEDWEEIQKPEEGCAVGMSITSDPDEIHHVGVYTDSDGGRVVHCWGRYNVIADTLRGLALKGFRVVRFYRHKAWPSS